MPEDPTPGGHITDDNIAQLATLLDGFEFAFDPLSRDAREAESEFTDLVQRLYDEVVKPIHPNVSLVAFQCHIKTCCRQYIRKNLPTDPTDRPHAEI